METYLPVGVIAQSRATEIDSRVAENTIAYGAPVKQGTTPGSQVKAWDGASGSVFDGISVRAMSADLDNDQFVQYDAIPVLRKGVISVKAAGTVAVGDKVSVNAAGGFVAGPLTEGSTGTYGVDIIGSEFKSAGDSGDYVLIELNMPCETTLVQV